MDKEMLKRIGLTSKQIDQVLHEHNRTKHNEGSIVINERLEKQRKRDEILSIEDNHIRQKLILENMELF